jgi:hypothetical protein
MSTSKSEAKRLAIQRRVPLHTLADEHFMKSRIQEFIGIDTDNGSVNNYRRIIHAAFKAGFQACKGENNEP